MKVCEICKKQIKTNVNNKMMVITVKKAEIGIKNLRRWFTLDKKYYHYKCLNRNVFYFEKGELKTFLRKEIR